MAKCHYLIFTTTGPFLEVQLVAGKTTELHLSLHNFLVQASDLRHVRVVQPVLDLTLVGTLLVCHVEAGVQDGHHEAKLHKNVRRFLIKLL